MKHTRCIEGRDIIITLTLLIAAELVSLAALIWWR